MLRVAHLLAAEPYETVTDTSNEGPAHQVTYGYDYRGVRVSRTETPTDAGSSSRYFFYTPELQFLSSTVDDSNNVWGQSAHIMSTQLVMNREVVWFAGQPVAEYGPPRTSDATGPLSLHRTFGTNTPANNLFYTFTDHLGTPLLQTDLSTAIVWRAEYEPYGNVYLMRKGSRADQPLRFPGQEEAMTWEGTEENYNVFRWYRAGGGGIRKRIEYAPKFLSLSRMRCRTPYGPPIPTAYTRRQALHLNNSNRWMRPYTI
jgi:uncharacterized protein RhaS with RHS repeats